MRHSITPLSSAPSLLFIHKNTGKPQVIDLSEYSKDNTSTLEMANQLVYHVDAMTAYEYARTTYKSRGSSAARSDRRQGQ